MKFSLALLILLCSCAVLQKDKAEIEKVAVDSIDVALTPVPQVAVEPKK